ncbi:MAG: hypothetical protein AAFZ87_07310 [Planctomycetota bacterium]
MQNRPKHRTFLASLALFLVAWALVPGARATSAAADAATTAAQEKKEQTPEKDAAGKAKGQKSAAAKDAEGPWRGEPYTLETCAASGRPIDVKGTPQTQWMHGRELKFCCKGCAAAVEKDPARWLAKVDKALTAQQAPIYPTDECVIAGTPLYDDAGKFTGKELIVGNRLFRVCCDKCAARVKKDPAKYAGKLNELVVAAAAVEGAYPLDVCPVSDDAPIDDTSKTTVVAGRAIKTCCKACAKEVMRNPLPYIAAVDAAAAKKRGEAAEPKKGSAPAAGSKGDSEKAKGDQKKGETSSKG